MLDFFEVCVNKTTKNRDVVFEVYPDFNVGKDLKDLMIRGRDFYAVWNEKTQMWSTNENDVTKQVDAEIRKKAEELREKYPMYTVSPKYMRSSRSGVIDYWHRYAQKQLRDSYEELDSKIVFSNMETQKEDFISKKLDYPLEPGEISAYDELIGTLYDSEERDKLEWAIGAIISGDSKKIQKFIVLYGSAGSGKSTFLNIVQMLFKGYYSVFDAKVLASNNNQYALESFKSNPLVAIQHDGDLSRIEDNTKLNSIVSHEQMEVNEKYKPLYVCKFNTFLFMGTNKPVKITEAKSGILRRLIDVKPSGNKIPFKKYMDLLGRVKFELSGIAYHCLEKYQEMGENYYDTYIPVDMFSITNDFYDFMEYNFNEFVENDSITLKAAWKLYNDYCEYAKIQYPFSMRTMKSELKNYFREYEERKYIDGQRIRSVYTGFITDKFINSFKKEKEEQPDSWIILKEQDSLLDEVLKDCNAQLSKISDGSEIPKDAWDNVVKTLKDIDTHLVHYVRIPEKHIVIDFDLKNEKGEKDLKLNLNAASKWPPTYVEVSKGGAGLHLHYIYSGDPSLLVREYAPNIEVKVFTGKSSLRRRVSLCNDLQIATIGSGLPIKKGGAKVYNHDSVKNEKMLRSLIRKALDKEIHPDTTSNVNFIKHILDEAYDSGVHYDVSDLQNTIYEFASNSTNQANTNIKTVGLMVFKSDDVSLADVDYTDDRMVFFDCEVFKNLFVICWKFAGDSTTVRMINPKPQEVEALMQYKLVGFNCRKYDNHILYGRMMGKSNMSLYRMSQAIVGNKKDAFIGEAYNVSYTDIYDFSSKKQSLKKWEIELGIHHQELGLRWDEEIPENLWEKVADYCVNDVVATEAVFNHLEADWKARQILVMLANALAGEGSTVNDTTNTLTIKIITRGDKKANQQFIYPDLSKEFPGYEFNEYGIDKSRYISKEVIISGKSIYKGYDPGEGGFVYATHGMYGRSKSLDSASHHPSTIIAENGFGPYTPNFKLLLDIRLMIKHKEYDKVRGLFDGLLAPYLTSDKDAKDLSYALKIAINSVYGLTAAHFDNALRDPRNVDNWVAKRGALFMIELMLQVKDMGYNVIHVKTDSIKIENPDEKIEKFVYEFGKKYGYTFEVEHVFDRICLVNDAVYVCKYTEDPENGKDAGKWDATGKQFQIPYVFKTLFSKEQIEFEDMKETMSVQTAFYLDMNENLPDVSALEKEQTYLENKKKRLRKKALDENVAYSETDYVHETEPIDIRLAELPDEIAKGHNYIFVGKAGAFTPIKHGCGGGLLMREKDGKYHAASGTKGYRWLETEVVANTGKQKDIDTSYYKEMVDEAVSTISEFGNFEMFTSDEPYEEILI